MENLCLSVASQWPSIPDEEALAGPSQQHCPVVVATAGERHAGVAGNFECLS